MQDDVNVTRGLPPRVRGEPLSGTFNLSCISPDASAPWRRRSTTSPRLASVKWAALVLVLALGGCTASTPGTTDAATPSSTPSATSTKAAVPALPAVAPKTLDEKTAKAETERIASAIEALLDPSDIVHIDKHAQAVNDAESSATFYGSLLTLTLSPSVEPVAQAKDIVATMSASGWAVNQTQDAAGVYLSALTSKAGWFVLVGGDSSTEGQSVVTLQLASPDLPH
ncbi:hypothetical protein BH11ACT2_BH11ACT2_18990 [soil metagenome]